MPSGVPVATVALNGAKNAGLLAVQILSTANDTLRDQFIEYKEGLRTEIHRKLENFKKP
jgi:5-(carboxyamino)imidazole ribonucleotide mutase